MANGGRRTYSAGAAAVAAAQATALFTDVFTGVFTDADSDVFMDVFTDLFIGVFIDVGGRKKTVEVVSLPFFLNGSKGFFSSNFQFFLGVVA